MELSVAVVEDYKFQRLSTEVSIREIFQIRCKVCSLILDVNKPLKNTKGYWCIYLRFKAINQ